MEDRIYYCIACQIPMVMTNDNHSAVCDECHVEEVKLYYPLTYREGNDI